MWDKALQVSTNALKEFEHETTFILNQAIALLMLDQKDDAIKAIHDLIILDPGLKDDVLENELLSSVKKEILEL
jgi:predicted Zn-dependent protease